MKDPNDLTTGDLYMPAPTQYDNELFIQNRIGALNMKRERQRKVLESTDAEIAYWTDRLATIRNTPPKK